MTLTPPPPSVEVSKVVPSFGFLGYGVTEQAFHEVARPPGAGPVKPSEGEVKIQVQSGVSITVSQDPLRCEVRMNLTVEPDPAQQPYFVRVEVAGAFSVLENGSEAELAAFAKSNAPTILFPFLRALIYQLTADGRYGPVRLHPMNLRDAFQGDRWVRQEVASEAKRPVPQP